MEGVIREISEDFIDMYVYNKEIEGIHMASYLSHDFSFLRCQQRPIVMGSQEVLLDTFKNIIPDDTEIFMRNNTGEEEKHKDGYCRKCGIELHSLPFTEQECIEDNCTNTPEDFGEITDDMNHRSIFTLVCLNGHYICPKCYVNKYDNVEYIEGVTSKYNL